MSQLPEIRETTARDIGAIAAMYPQAFPDEDLVPLVLELLQEASATLSLAAEINSALVGHGLFTRGHVEGSGENIALLGPLAVSPAQQKRGIGTTIVRNGLRRLRDSTVTRVLVLGDPAYYVRFGFAPETRVAPPYEIPTQWNAAWQSLCLGEATEPGSGALVLPKPWLKPELWAPIVP